MRIEKDMIRELQKAGEYKFKGLTREESKIAATELAVAAREQDKQNGIESSYGIGRDGFGFYKAIQINN